jgi:hypothetical protein
MQNLENKRFILPLCARSLSFKDLHAKSREHASYGGRRTDLMSRFGTGRAQHLKRGMESHAITRVRLSKIGDYLPDNVSCLRLSGLGHAVNDKTAEASLQWEPEVAGRSLISCLGNGFLDRRPVCGRLVEN